jgi:hypothetical protein
MIGGVMVTLQGDFSICQFCYNIHCDGGDSAVLG